MFETSKYIKMIKHNTYLPCACSEGLVIVSFTFISCLFVLPIYIFHHFLLPLHGQDKHGASKQILNVLSE